MFPLTIPSPEINAINIGPLSIHFYALCIITGAIVAFLWAKKRWVARGGDADQLFDILFVAAIAGVIGARIYHVFTSPTAYFGPEGHMIDALKIWNGGLGIWGGVIGGGIAGVIMCRRYGVSAAALADTVAPTLLVAQAIGRLGNWFNQEIYGGPTDLPWGLHITCRGGEILNCTPGYYHPTFLYEMLWNLAGAALLIAIEKRFNIFGSRLFWLYVVVYTCGRIWIEMMRTDPAQIIFGQRLNVWTSALGLVVGLTLFIVIGIKQQRDEKNKAIYATTL